jgi:hypothetical protein
MSAEVAQVSSGILGMGTDGAAFKIAAEGFKKRHAGFQTVVVSIGHQGWSSEKLARVAAVNGSAAAATVCGGATAAPPKSDAPLTVIPHSHLVWCADIENKSVMAVTFARDNLFVLVLAGAEPRTLLVRYAVRQYRAIPNHDFVAS